MPVNGRQIADFHAYQLQCDLLLDRMEEEEAVAELEFRICVRRLWAEFAFQRRRRDWEYLDVFIYYDMRIERQSAQLGEFGHIDLVRAGSKAFVRRLQAPGTPFLYRGTGHWAACRRSGDDEDLASSVQMLLMNFVVSSGAEGKIWHVVGEAMFFATTLPADERAGFLDAAGRLQHLWEFLDGPLLQSEEVEDLICYFLDNNLPEQGSIPPEIRRESRWLRSLAEALMVKTIPAISGFARELANYHPSFDEASSDFDDEFRFRHYVRYRASRFADQFDC